jgi:hypothetical protein|tara:strand:- start:96 stop:299 length:204 start_codon:yes stop_codon:yes gene_type:complete
MNKNCLYILLFIIIFVALVNFYPKEVAKNTIETMATTVNQVTEQAGGTISNELKNLMECNKILSTII